MSSCIFVARWGECPRAWQAWQCENCLATREACPLKEGKKELA